MIIEKTVYEEYIRSSQQDFDSRWEHVKELVNLLIRSKKDKFLTSFADRLQRFRRGRAISRRKWWDRRRWLLFSQISRN